MGEESALRLVDEGSFGEFWKIEKRSPFLESGSMRQCRAMAQLTGEVVGV